jgi:hypothetical protein
MSHDHTDFGAQITFLGSEGLFSPFDPDFLLHVRFSIRFGPLGPIFGFDPLKYIFHASCTSFGPEFRFWVREPIFAFLTPKSVYFFIYIKFPIDCWVA